MASKTSTRKSKRSAVLETITFEDREYRPDRKRDVYLSNLDDGKASILVFCVDEHNWYPYKNVRFVSKMATVHDMDDDDAWRTFTIDLALYDADIQYIDYQGGDPDAGETFVAFDIKQFLKSNAPDLFEKVKKLVGKRPNERLVWYHYH